MTNYYTALGLPAGASIQSVRAAYKSLALRYHPDKTKHLSSSEQERYTRMFHSIQGAAEHLSDPARKYAYDASPARSTHTTHANSHKHHASASCPSPSFAHFAANQSSSSGEDATEHSYPPAQANPAYPTPGAFSTESSEQSDGSTPQSGDPSLSSGNSSANSPKSSTSTEPGSFWSFSTWKAWWKRDPKVHESMMVAMAEQDAISQWRKDLENNENYAAHPSLSIEAHAKSLDETARNPRASLYMRSYAARRAELVRQLARRKGMEEELRWDAQWFIGERRTFS